MEIFRKSMAGMLVVLTVIVISFHPINAQESANTPQQLLAKAQKNGTVRVIVHLKMDYAEEGQLKSSSAIADQHHRIANTQQKMLDKLGGKGVFKAKKFSTIPFMALQVASDTLESLMQDDAILAIQEDKLSAPVLDQSVPRINAGNVPRNGYAGSGYAVAVLDTGVMSQHSFLAGKILSEACFSTTDAAESSVTLCPNGGEAQIGIGAGVNCSTSIDSGCSHGTHVAGIAAGNNGVPGNGVAPGASVIPIQVFSKITDSYSCGGDATCVLAWDADLVLALEHVYALRGTYKIAAVNMSLGGGFYSGYCDSTNAAIKAVIDNLRTADIATVISSGNSGYDGYIGAPACISSAVAVGATESSSDAVASYSNINSVVDLMAPGSAINSSVATCPTCYDSWDGTSMAAPHVAGAFALMKSVYPALSVSQIETWFKDNGVIVSRDGYSKPRIDFANLSYPSTGIIPSKVTPAISLLLLSGPSAPPVPCPIIPNGTFESGRVSWVESSSNGRTVVTNSLDVAPYAGSWAAKFGGINSETASIQQQITVSPSCPTLSFWNRITSSEYGCYYDYGYVRINGVTVATYPLCTETNTSGWSKKSINLSGYSGQTVTLQFRTTTDSSILSSWYIDNVSFE